MKRATIFAAAAAAAGILALSGAVQTQAAGVKAVSLKNMTVLDSSTLKDYFGSYDWGSCKVITIPCLPGNGNNGIVKPETPDNNKPETPDHNKPETPDNNKPENKPETPDTEKPGEDDSLQGMSAYAQRVVELVNEERAKAGLKPVTVQKNITAAAQVRAVETVSQFSHTRPDGTSFSTALKEQGVSYRGSGENIAWGQKTPEQVMNGWMNSAGHRANILNAKFTSIGVGYHQTSGGVNYWTQLFTY